MHIFIECPRLATLLRTANMLISKLTNYETIPLQRYILGPKRGKSLITTHRLACYIITTVKAAIHITRFKKINNSPDLDALQVYKSKLKSRIREEYNNHRSMSTLNIFEEQWTIYDSLLITHL